MEMIWIVIGVLAIVLELSTPSAMVSIWFAVGAFVSAVCAFFNLPIVVQIIVCLVVTVLFILIVRPMAVKYMRGNIVATNADRLIGDIAVVTKEIKEDAWGEVRVQGMTWSAVDLHHSIIPEHAKVRIVAIEGAKLLVKAINQKEDV